MSYPVWVEIVCGRCSEHGPGAFTYAGIPRRDMKTVANDQGWALIEDAEGDLDWLCPACKKGVTH